MYVHTGTWPFKCEVCQRGFSKQTNLKNHMQLHISDKEKLSESNIVFKRKGLGQFFLNNNTVEDIKEEVDESFTNVKSELTKIFRPINFS